MSVMTARIILLGPPTIERDGAAVPIDTRKTMALAAYLAVTERSHPRDVLAALLWPESDATHARAVLRRDLSILNKAVAGHWIVADRETIGTNPESSIFVDVHQFRRLAADGLTRDPDDRAALPILEQAAALWRGDFLEGFAVAASPELDDWRTVVTEELTRTLGSVLERLAATRQSMGDHDRAISAARRWLELDPLHEAAQYRLMAVQLAAGNRVEALRQYHRYVTRLDSELGITPGARLSALADSIRTATSGNDEHAMSAAEPAAPHTPSITRTAADRSPGETCPYRGLLAFRERDAPSFFGRAVFTRHVLTALESRPVVGIVGPSGSGKSSLMMAGVLPRLRAEQSVTVAAFRPVGDPFRGLAQVLTRLLGAEVQAGALAADGGVLTDLASQLCRAEGTERLVLAVDQLEELHSLCDEPVRSRFLDLLVELIELQQFEAAPAVTVLFTLRADFLEPTLANRPFAESVRDALLVLGPLLADELAEAIERPAQMHNVSFEPDLVRRIVADLADAPGCLPLLGFALTALWEKRSAAVMTHSAYERIGGAVGALAQHADTTLAALPPREQAIARRVLVQVVQPGETTEDIRRIAYRHELDAASWAVAQRLADARLLVTGTDGTGGETVEVAHEALIRGWPTLREWMHRDRAFRTWQERLRSALRQWEQSGRDDGALLRGVPLAQAEAWLSDRSAEVGAPEHAFIVASVALRDAEQRRRGVGLRRRALLFAGLGMIAALLALMAGTLALRSSRLARTAAARQLVADAELQRATRNSELALLLALQSLRRADEMGALHLVRQLLGDPALALWTLPYPLPLGAARERAFRFPGAAWAPDGRRILTWGDQSTRVLDARDGTSLLELATPFAAVAGWSADGRRILTASHATVQVWDAISANNLLEIPTGHTDFIRAVHPSPDDARILTVSEDGTAMVWDARSAALRTRFAEHTMPVSGSGLIEDGSWSPDGRLVMTNSADDTARVWDAATGSELLVLRSGEGMGVIESRWSPDRSRILTASADGTIRIWSADTGELLQRFRAHDGSFGPDTDARLGLFEARWSHAGDLIVTAGGSEGRIWDARSGAQLLELSHDRVVWGARWNADDDAVVTISKDSSARVWDAATGRLRHSLIHDGPVHAVAWSPDGRQLVTGTESATRIWDLTVRPGDVRPPIGERIDGASYSPDGALLLTVSTAMGQAAIWQVGTGRRIATLGDDAGGVRGARWSRSGRILSYGSDGSVRIWEPSSGRELLSITAHEGAVLDAAWHPTETLIVTTGEDQQTRLWDGATGVQLPLAADSYALDRVGWSRDGRRLLGRSRWSHAYRAWDAHSGEPLGLAAAIGADRDAVWDANGKRLGVSGRKPQLVALTGGAVTKLQVDRTSSVGTLVWSGDQSRMLGALEDGTARIWNAASGEPLLVFEGHGAAVTSVAWNADESLLLTASADHTARIWDARTGEARDVLPHSAPVQLAAWSPDHSRVMTLSDGRVRQFLTDRDAVVAMACARLGRDLSAAEWDRYLPEEPQRPTCDGHRS